MARTQSTYPHDEFDNYTGLAGGAHRGQKTVLARATPYIITVLIAALCGLLLWAWMSGVIGGDSFASSNLGTAISQRKSSTSQTSADSKATSTDNSTSTSTDSSTSHSDASKSTSTDASSSSTASTNSQSSTTTTTPAATVNKSTAIVVYNGNNVAGFAGQKRSVLVAAGYTAVTATNPQNYNSLPPVATVWYVKDSDAVTAKDVASQLGISAVEKVSTLAQGSIAVIAK